MTRSVWRRTAAAVLFLSSAWACTLLNPLDEYGPGGPKADAAGDVVTVTDAGEDAGCKRERWPGRPPADSPGADVGELVFAAETIDVAPPDGGAQVSTGFDLDGVCTCPGPPSCTGPAGKVVCDDPGGVDIGGTTFLEQALAVGGGSVTTNEQLRAGERGLLFRLRNYNGGPDDTRVELSILLTGGNEGAEVDAPKRPARDGNDAWTVDPRSVFGGTGPPYVPTYVDPDAYVSGGTIVSTVGRAGDSFPLSLSTVTMKLDSAVLTARLARAGDKYRLEDGRFVGRWSTKELLTSLDTIRDPVGGPDSGLCGDSGLYQQLKKEICAAVDITRDPAQDSRGAACDALAVRVLFTAGPAKLGVLYGRTPGRRRCGEGWSDDCVR